VRTLVRLVVLVAVLLSSVALSPVASADGTASTGTTDAATGTTGTTGDTTTDQPTDPTTENTNPPPTDTDTGSGTGTGTDLGTGETDPPTPPPSTDPTPPAALPVTTLDRGPANPTRVSAGSVVPSVFAFHADLPDATFQCRIIGAGGKRGIWEGCPGGVAGQATYPVLVGGSYTFQVRATLDGGLTYGNPTPEFTWQVLDCTTTMTLCKVFAPDRYSPPAGARFNNPTGERPAQRRNLTHVIRTINSMPGYAVKSTLVCDPRNVPSTIRISLYSLTDMPVARALRAASRRCVSVRVLMNSHLKPKTTPAVNYLQSYLGASVTDAKGVRRSFAHRCHYGCRGAGTLHAKFYLFDSRLVVPGGAAIAKTVMVGSSNMTANASKVQWNDLYTVRNDATLHGQFLYMFTRMQRDRDEFRTFRFNDGIYQTTFTPLTPNSSDPTLAALNSIHCSGATGGTGYAGHTVVHINMHAWFGLRGYAFAKRVRDMYDAGCYVKVLYSFMSRSVYKKLTYGTGSRMSVRRTIFSRHGGIHATLYSHFKMIAASGVVGTNRAASVVWTGSNNFTNDGVRFDEVTFRIASRAAWVQYVNQFAFITRTRTSGTYASFAEPIGGGRAVDAGV
jgi:phospholipase D-like protein